MPLFLFRQAQQVQVFSLKPASFCKLSDGLGSTNKSAFLFCCSLIHALSSPPCPLLRLSFYLKLSGNSVSLSCSIGYNGPPDTRFSRGTIRLMSWSDKERYLCPLQSLVVSLLLSLVVTLLFSRTGGVLSHLNFSTNRFPRHARCVLSRLRFNGHSLLFSFISAGLAESRILHAAPADTSHLILHCPAKDSLRCSLFGDSLSLYDLWSGPWKVARLLGLHGLPPCPHLSEGVGKQQVIESLITEVSKANNSTGF